MQNFEGLYVHLKGVLDETDIAFLKESAKAQLETEDIPCFGLVNKLQSASFHKIKELVENEMGRSVNYLNDFYMYTDSERNAPWHMDTELYTFEDAMNVWILLSPEDITSPLAIIKGINETADQFYHTIETKDDNYEFGNLCTGESELQVISTVEAQKVNVPDISVGDILLFNPRRFHKTNTTVPKHAYVIKFVYGNQFDCLSNTQVPGFFWPEVDMFNALVKGQDHWSGVIDGLRQALRTTEGKENLSAGFYPENFPNYKKGAKLL